MPLNCECAGADGAPRGPFPPAQPGAFFPGVIYTIGHSTRTLDAFLELLTGRQVALVVDVRRFPKSRRHPHFERDALADALALAGIAYQHAGELGGRRSPRPDSANGGWRSLAFRGYADYMETAAFKAALDGVIARAPAQQTALLCAEAVPWRCHRQLVADALVARDEEVGHILSAARVEPHVLSAHARVLPGGALRYPPTPADQLSIC